jgi:hypothetical protein
LGVKIAFAKHTSVPVNPQQNKISKKKQKDNKTQIQKKKKFCKTKCDDFFIGYFLFGGGEKPI